MLFGKSKRIIFAREKNKFSREADPLGIMSARSEFLTSSIDVLKFTFKSW